MPLETQAKLLRAIQEKEFERVGGNQPIRVDVRLLAATNQDLEARGPRRPLPRGPLLPPARRRADRSRRCTSAARTSRCSSITSSSEAAQRFHRERQAAHRRGAARLLRHDWRGNVRELRSAVEQALLLAPGRDHGRGSLRPRHRERPCHRQRRRPAPLTANARRCRSARPRSAWSTTSSASSCQSPAPPRRQHHQAAEEVGMYRQNFQQKMRELGIKPDDALRAFAARLCEAPDRREGGSMGIRVPPAQSGSRHRQSMARPARARNPAAVYEAAIQERLEQYVKLRRRRPACSTCAASWRSELELKTARAARCRATARFRRRSRRRRRSRWR